MMLSTFLNFLTWPCHETGWWSKNVCNLNQILRYENTPFFSHLLRLSVSSVVSLLFCCRKIFSFYWDSNLLKSTPFENAQVGSCQKLKKMAQIIVSFSTSGHSYARSILNLLNVWLNIVTIIEYYFLWKVLMGFEPQISRSVGKRLYKYYCR